MDPATERPSDVDDGKFIDIVITEDSDRSILPDEILFHLEAGGDAAATAELERRAEAELDEDMRRLEAGLPLLDDEDEEEV